MRYCVIGAGSGGRAFAVYLASKGGLVNLYNRSFSRIKYIKKKKRIKTKGALKGSSDLENVTQDLETAVKDVDVIMIAIPAFAHKDIAKKIAPYLKTDQIIILNPGRTFGTIEFKQIIDEKRKNLNVYIAETQTLLFTARALKKHKVRIFKIKDAINFCSYPEKNNFFIKDTLKDIFPQFQPVDNYLQLTLNNIGMLLHPTITLLNSGSIENGLDFKYYKEGASKRICQILETIQLEINQIFRKLGVRRFDFCKWANQVYGVSGKSIFESIQKIDSYEEINSPYKLETRYFTEDVPTGLVPLASLGRFLNVNTPTIDSIIHLSSVLCGIDFWEEGRTIENLNINRLLEQKIDVEESMANVFTERTEYLQI